MFQPNTPQARQWAFVLYRSDPQLFQDFIDHEVVSKVPELNIDTLPLREQIVSKRILKTFHGRMYEYPWDLTTDSDFQTLRYVMSESIAVLESYANRSLSLYFTIEHTIDECFKRADTRHNYKIIAESICHRSGAEGRFDIRHSNRSIQKWCESSYKHEPDNRTIRTAYRFFQDKEFMSITTGQVLNHYKPTEIRLRAEYLTPSSDESTIKWLNRHRESFECVLDREVLAHQEVARYRKVKYVEQ